MSEFLTLFHKRMTPQTLAEVNDYIIGRKIRDSDDEDIKMTHRAVQEKLLQIKAAKRKKQTKAD